MTAIRRQYHYSRLIMSPDIFEVTNVMCGQTVDVINELGQIDRVFFDGFINLAQTNTNAFCLVKNVVGFTTGDAPFVGGWIDFHKDQLFIAVLNNNNAVKLVIFNSNLMSAGY